jgi:hypothetical protein
MLTVKDLIEELEKQDQDAIIVVDVGQGITHMEGVSKADPEKLPPFVKAYCSDMFNAVEIW